MDKIEKLFKKISMKDREDLLDLISLIDKNDKDLKIVKIKNTDFMRVRFKNYRVIFHREAGEIVVDSIKMRNEKTYKNL